MRAEVRQLIRAKLPWALTTLGLGLTGLLLNFIHLEVLPGVHLLLGPICTAVAAAYLGPAGGVTVGAISGARTWWLWNQPYSWILYAAEGAVAGWLLRRYPRCRLIVALLIYWVGLGCWLNLLAQHYLNGFTWQIAFVLQGRSLINALVTGLVAELIVFILPLLGLNLFPVRRYSFSAVLSLLLVTGVAIPGLYSFRLHIRTLEDEIVSAQNTADDQKLTALKQGVNSYLTNSTRIIGLVASLADPANLQDTARLQPILEKTRQQYPNFAGLYIADAAGTTWAFDPIINYRGERTIGLNFSDRKYYHALKTTLQPVVSEVYQARGGMFTPTIAVGAPIVVNGAFKGLALGWFNLDVFNELVRVRNNDHSAQVVITDDEGNLIADSTLPKERYLAPRNYAKDEGYKFALQNRRGEGRYLASDSVRQPAAMLRHQYRVIYETVEPFGWKLWVKRSTAPLNAALLQLYRRSLLLLLAALLVALLLAHVMANLLVRPLDALRMSAEQFAQGDLTARPKVRRSISLETESLINSFNYMAANLKHSYESLLAAEQEAHRQRQFLTRLVESAEHLIYTIAADGQITWANSRVAELLKLTPLEVIGLHWPSLVHPDDQVRVNQLFAEALQGENRSYETRLLNPITGQEHHFAIINSPVFEQDEIIGVLGIAREITEQVQLRRQLLQSEKMSAVGQLVSGVAHELNNPLTGILGFTQLALQEPTVKEPIQGYLQNVETQSLRARKIVQNLLTFARRQKFEKRPIQLNQVITATVDLRQYDLHSNGIEIQTDLTEPLPPVLADFNQLQQVLLNLIINAEQAILEKQRRGWIKISTSLVQGGIRVMVQDSGPGIAAKHLERIFDPFFTTKEVGKGTGLGLSICYGIVSEHNGTIWAKSPPGQGAIFCLELPPSAVEAPVDTAPSALAESRPRTRHILVVDDEESILTLLRTSLTTRGYQVDTTVSGFVALEMVRRKKYDLVISDIKMPELPGPELLEALCQIDASLRQKIIFATGDSISERTAEFLEQIKTECLLKPFSMDELFAALAKFFEQADRPRPGSQYRSA